MLCQLLSKRQPLFQPERLLGKPLGKRSAAAAVHKYGHALRVCSIICKFPEIPVMHLLHEIPDQGAAGLLCRDLQSPVGPV